MAESCGHLNEFNEYSEFYYSNEDYFFEQNIKFYNICYYDNQSQYQEIMEKGKLIILLLDFFRLTYFFEPSCFIGLTLEQ